MVYLQPKCSAQREHSNGVSFSFWDKKLEEHERKEIYVCNSFISRGKYFGCGFMLLGWTMPCTNESSLPCGNTALCVCITELQPDVGDVTSPPSPSSPATKHNSTITCHGKPGGWILHKVRLLPSFFCAVRLCVWTCLYVPAVQWLCCELTVIFISRRQKYIPKRRRGQPKEINI